MEPCAPGRSWRARPFSRMTSIGWASCFLHRHDFVKDLLISPERNAAIDDHVDFRRAPSANCVPRLIDLTTVVLPLEIRFQPRRCDAAPRRFRGRAFLRRRSGRITQWRRRSAHPIAGFGTDRFLAELHTLGPRGLSPPRRQVHPRDGETAVPTTFDSSSGSAWPGRRRALRQPRHRRRAPAPKASCNRAAKGLGRKDDVLRRRHEGSAHEV